MLDIVSILLQQQKRASQVCIKMLLVLPVSDPSQYDSSDTPHDEIEGRTEMKQVFIVTIYVELEEEICI